MNTYHISITYHKLSLQKSKTSTCLPFFVSYRPILIFKILSQILSKKFIDSLLSGTLIVYIRKGQRNTKALREKDRTQKKSNTIKNKAKVNLYKTEANFVKSLRVRDKNLHKRTKQEHISMNIKDRDRNPQHLRTESRSMSHFTVLVEWC